HTGFGEVEYFWSGDESTRYTFLASAMCGDCRRYLPPMPYRYRGAFTYRDRAASDSLHILSKANRLVNPIAGPIRSLQRFEPTGRAPALKHWVADVADPGWCSLGRSSLACGGSAIEDDVARAAALGEAVERSSVCPPAYDHLPIASYSDILD